MEIRTKYKIERKKISELEIMRAYVIFDEKTHDNNLIIVDTNHEAIILSKHDNDPSLCILRMDKDSEVNVIGEVDDFDLVNVRYRS